ncbi:lamin tail domain-containing protein [Halarchaeum sp. P4]|uniref:lamin tail domain-containing protein n=1 Tax=Halarchaeum sp. P4 TaxID=3421639 RepID=UPI003EBCBE7F
MKRPTLLALCLCLLCVTAGCVSPGSSPTPETTATDGTTASGPTTGDAANLSPRGATLNATVVDVADGDTVDVRFANGTTDTVRLVGIDTPEVWSDNTPEEFRGVPSTAAGRECLRTWGERASDYTKERLAGAHVTLAFDPNTDRRGYYGRLLAYVYVNGTNHNYALIEQGFARVYESGFSRQPRFSAAMNASYDAREGLWSCATGDGSGGSTSTTASSTTTAGAGSSALVVASVNADAAGPDGENLNDEYVVLENTGEESLALGGATVTDAAGHAYTFPSGATLAAGATLTLHTGSGTDTANDYYWGASSPVWNNGGDAVTVRAANGTVLARYEYA